VHVSKNDWVNLLGDHVRTLAFHDAAKSWQDPALVGPPTLEYSPYPKMPGGRRRNDNRQGTIDQDQDFKDFLESLTNPITKPPAPDADAAKDTKVKTTPLIEALREKKANKDKPNTKASRHGRGDKDDSNDHSGKKILAKPGKENAAGSGDKSRRSAKGDKAQATKEAVKILNKEASARGAASTSTDKASATSAPERKRGNVALAKSMLQRDLGLGPGPAPSRRRGTKREVASASDAATPAKETPAADSKSKAAPAAQNATPPASEKTAQAAQKKERPTRAERRAFKASLADTPNNNKTASADAKSAAQPKGASAPAPQILKKPQSAQAPATSKGQSSRNQPSEPATARASPAPAKQQSAAKTEAPPAPAANTAKSAPPRPVPDATSKQAFLKHANPSQGITEPLIEEALKAFGGIQKVEIDKRKGFAYVDFVEPEGLQKAMAASPIKIAQGAVQVLERKEKVARNPRFNAPPTGPARGGRGGFAARGRGRGGARGGHGSAASAAPAAVAGGDAAT
jgi:regulator of nonsense transcripts 3